VEYGGVDGRGLGSMQYVANLHEGKETSLTLFLGTPFGVSFYTISLLLTHFIIIIRNFQPKGQMPDYDSPVILHAENPTIEEFCNRLHRGLLAEFSHAWVCKYHVVATSCRDCYQ
jgi:hypothetical protein